MTGEEQVDEAVTGVAPVAGPPHENPTSRQAVHEWISRRVAADEQMRWAGAARKARDDAQQES